MVTIFPLLPHRCIYHRQLLHTDVSGQDKERCMVLSWFRGKISILIWIRASSPKDVFPRQSWMAGFDMNTHVFQSCLLQLRVNQTHFNVWNKARDVVLHPIPLLLVSYRNLSWFTQMWWHNMKLFSPGQFRIFLLHPGCLRKHLGCQGCAGGEMEEAVCCFGRVIRMF